MTRNTGLGMIAGNLTFLHVLQKTAIDTWFNPIKASSNFKFKDMKTWNCSSPSVIEPSGNKVSIKSGNNEESLWRMLL